MAQKIKERQLLLEQKHRQELLDFFTVIRSQPHDFNFHINSLYGLLLGSNFEAAKDYIEEIVHRTTSE